MYIKKKKSNPTIAANSEITCTIRAREAKDIRMLTANQPTQYIYQAWLDLVGVAGAANQCLISVCGSLSQHPDAHKIGCQFKGQKASCF